jgi:ATP-dependent exoDNAse (exonuclease V) beta subunit
MADCIIYVMDIYRELHKFNDIIYNDSDHSYLIDGIPQISGTKLISKYKEPFDTEGIALKYAIKNNLDVNDVLVDWDLKRNNSANKGTAIHSYAELLLANKKFEPILVDDLIEAYNKCSMIFDKFHEDSKKSLIPIKSELVVGDKNFGVCGMVDQLFWNEKEQEYQIWDWKTNKEINKNSKFKKKMLAPIHYLDECEFNTYALQLSLYRYIIEKNTEIKIGSSYLLHITELKNTYEVIKVPYYVTEIERMLLLYKLTG